MSTIKAPYQVLIFSFVLLLNACGGGDGGGQAASDSDGTSNSNPVLSSSIPDLPAPEDSVFNYTVPADTFTDPDGDPLTYAATQSNGSPLPNWLSFDANSQSFAGTPRNADVGSITVQLTASDGRGGSANDTFLINVTNVNDRPVVLNPIADQDAFTENTFSFAIPTNTFADEDVGDTITLSVVESGTTGLPAWLTFNSGVESLEGMPTSGDVGTVTLDVTATDSSGAPVTDTFVITVAESVTLTGTVSVPNGTGADSDTNNENATNTPNNNLNEAQTVSAPIRIGGFLTVDATNNPGDQFQNNPDVNDYYRVNLRAGDIINLYIADHPGGTSVTPDLELELIDAVTESVVADSLSQTATESVTVPTTPGDGNYYVRVFAFSAGTRTNYLLTVGQESTPANRSPVSTFDDFVPGEIIAVNRSTFNIKEDEGERIAAFNAVGATLKAGAVDRPVLLSLPIDSNALETMQERYVNSVSTVRAEAAQERVDKLKTIWSMKRLSVEKGAGVLGLNYRRQPMRIPNDSLYEFQWHYPLINLPQAWDVTTGDNNVIVAVVDTGVVLSHPDLSGKLVAGYDFISSIFNALDGDGIDPNPDDPGDQAVANGSSWHGTHVTGTIAAATNNGGGVTGVGWNTRVMPIRALGALGGTSYDIMQSIRYAAGLSNDSNTVPAQPADIINLSLGGSGSSAAEQTEYTNVRNTGVIVVAAAGNGNTSQRSYPASYVGVISVSAVDLEKNRAYYSNFGSTIDIAAPGGDNTVDINGDSYVDGVLSTLVQNDGLRTPNYVFYQGTSMAAPHVAGVVALMKAVYPGLTPAELDGLISTGVITEDLAANGPTVRDNQFGYGLIDALAAVQEANALAGGGQIPPVIEVSPTSIDFGTGSSRTLSVTNGGGGTLRITNIITDQTWINVTPDSVDANGLGDYIVAIDRTGLSAGAYSGSITIESDTADNVVVNISMQVSVPTPSVGDAGLQYVWLLDADTRITVAQDMVTATNGAYDYELTGVVPGRYYLSAGSDMDNDSLICDLGESCGDYPTSSLSEVIVVNSENISGLDFTIDFPSLHGSTSLYINGTRAASIFP